MEESGIRSSFQTDRDGEVVNATDGLFAIADAISHLAKAIDRLGINGASTPLGALELVSEEIEKGLSNVSQGFFNGCETIAEALKKE